jgi:cyclohexadieny/prephenate dehydrogenase
MTGTAIFDTVAVTGHGHIGSSITRAIRKHGLAGRVVIADHSAEARARTVELGLVDAVHEHAADAAASADLVVVCTPVGTAAAVAEAIAPALKPGAVVTDVGSVKSAVIQAMSPHLPANVHFVPGHPVAGTEHSGPDAGFAELFEGRYWLLTPLPATPRPPIDRLVALLQGIGAIVEEMDAAYHDKVLAVTSHVPHLIAYTIVSTAFDLEEQEQRDVIRFSAGGFRDFTRIAGSNPVMWRDIFLNNRVAVLEMLQRFNEDLTYLQRAMRWGEGDKLEDLFTKTRAIRRGVIEANQAGTSPWDRRNGQKK